MTKPDPLGRVVRRRLGFLPDGSRTEATDRFMSGETIAEMFDDYRDHLPIGRDRCPKVADQRRRIYLAYCVRQDAVDRGLVPAIGLEQAAKLHEDPGTDPYTDFAWLLCRAHASQEALRNAIRKRTTG